MNIHLKAGLQKSIERWIYQNCELGIWPDVYVYDKLSGDMTDAAASVFDANENGQKFLEEQGK